MKRLLLLLTVFAITVSSAAVTRRALLIGVGEYEDSKWRNLSSVRDVNLLYNTLSSIGFTDIDTLTNKRAKHAPIVKALKNLAERCVGGDVVFVHFSGHGQRMVDTKGYGDKGLIETFIPYDAKRYYSKKYYGQNHLKDYELYDLFCAIQKKIGPNGCLMVSFDACHSSGMSREPEDSDEVIRGDGNVFGSGKNQLKRAAKKRYHKALDPSIYAQKIELSACGSDESNYQYKRRGYGSLSYLIYLGLKEQSKNNFSFDRLADYVTNEKNYRSIMTKQTPHRFPKK